MSRVQCTHCPWKKSVDPFDIPNGYNPDAHRALKSTITSGLASLLAESPMMACHEYPKGAEKPCVGWLVNQLGDGGNLGLRLRVILGEVDGDVRTVGKQHACFEGTLPADR